MWSPKEVVTLATSPG
jgi:hypothetical protein